MRFLAAFLALLGAIFATAGKATFVSQLGTARAKEQARLLVDQAIEHLGTHGSEADLLRGIARYIIDRDR